MVSCDNPSHTAWIFSHSSCRFCIRDGPLIARPIPSHTFSIRDVFKASSGAVCGWALSWWNSALEWVSSCFILCFCVDPNEELPMLSCTVVVNECVILHTSQDPTNKMTLCNGNSYTNALLPSLAHSGWLTAVVVILNSCNCSYRKPQPCCLGHGAVLTENVSMPG